MRKKSRKKMISILLFLLCFTIGFSAHISPASAAWIDTNNSPIYSGGEAGSLGTGEGFDTILENLGDVVDSIIGTLLGEFLVAIGDAINEVLWQAGIGLDSIIFGRVNGASRHDVAMFTFELAEKNIYGIVGMAMYSILSSIFIIFLLGILLYHFVAFIYTDGGPRARETLKETVSKFLLSVFAIVLFSQVLNILLYVKDLVLYGVIQGGNELYVNIASAAKEGFFGSMMDTTVGIAYSGEADAMSRLFGCTGDQSLVARFRTEAVGSGIMHGILYLGSVIITIYYAFSYIGVALSMTVTVALFPVSCVFNFREKGNIGAWMKALISFMATPVIDAILLYIPLIMSALNSPGLVILVSLFTLIPARTFVRSLLNLQRPLDVTKNVIGSAAALAAAGVRIGKGLSDAPSKNEDLAMADSIEAQAKALDDVTGGLEQKAIEVAGSEFMQPLNEDSMEGLSVQEKSLLREQHVNKGIERIHSEIGNAQKQMDENMIKSQEIGSYISSIDAENENLKWMAEEEKNNLSSNTNPDLRNGNKDSALETIYRGRIEDNLKKRAELVNEQKEIAKKNAHIQERKSVLLDKAKVLNAYSKSLNQKNKDSGSYQMDRVLGDNANFKNFETPAYKNIPLERKAELYRARSQAVFKSFGSSPAVVLNGSADAYGEAYEKMLDGYSTVQETPVARYAAEPYIDQKIISGNMAFQADKDIVNNYRSDWYHFAVNSDNHEAYTRLKMDALNKAVEEARREYHSQQQEYTGPAGEEYLYRKQNMMAVWEKAKKGYVDALRRNISEYQIMSDATLKHPDYDTEEGVGFIARDVLAADESELLRKLSVKGILKGDVTDFVKKENV